MKNKNKTKNQNETKQKQNKTKQKQTNNQKQRQKTNNLAVKTPRILVIYTLEQKETQFCEQSLTCTLLWFLGFA